MPKKEKFPLAIKAGSSVVKIYRDPRPSGDYYRVAFYLGGKRQRLIFRDLDRAKNEATAKAAQLARGDVDAAQLTGKDRLTYGRAVDAIRPLGIPLDAAAIEYAEASKMEGKLVSDAVEDFRQAKIAAGRSAPYIKDIAYRLGKLSRAFHVEVRQLSPRDMVDFLDSMKLQARGFTTSH
jgi:hypothetical protein